MSLITKFVKLYGFILPIFILFQVLVLIIRVQGLRNSQLLVDVGTKIIGHQNPYDPPQPYGGFPGLIYLAIVKLSFSNSPWIFISLNIVGVVLLLNYLLPSSTGYAKMTILSVLLFTSPIRALTANVQHTGVILGSCILATYLFAKKKNNKNIFFMNFIGCSLFIFALEIKPQIAFPFIITWFIINRRLALFFAFIGEIFVIHVSIDLWVHDILELKLLGVWEIMHTNPQAISEQISIWKLLSLFSSLDLLQISFMLYAIILITIISAAIVKPSNQLLKFALVIPMLTAYLHLYDIIIIAIIICYWLVENKNKFYTTFLLGMLIIPTDLNSINQYLYSSIYIIAVTIALLYGKEKISLKDILLHTCQIILAYFTMALISFWDKPLEVRASLQISLTMIIVIYLSSRKKLPSRITIANYYRRY